MKWYREKLKDLKSTTPILSVCGDDCSVCPRYLAKTQDELRQTAEFWFHAGWRDHIVSNEEIICHGCGTGAHCAYDLLPCTAKHQVSRCSNCPQYPCQRLQTMLANSANKQPQCKQACETKEEYRMLCRAFYEKEKNL